MDYQARYLAHQARKKACLAGKYEKEITYSNKEKEVLAKICANRNSSRVYNGESVDKELPYIEKLVRHSPSSCDRKAVSWEVISDRDDKELLGGILVGGVGWIHRADKILLLLADLEAYRGSVGVLPYLDAGVIIQSFYLASEVMGVKCCYVNPNIREQNLYIFKKFSNKLFCGAIALGK